MATITPSNLYTGGAVSFNSTPYAQFTIGMMAKKAAKDEALDAYYRDLNKSINPAGVRTQDIGGFMQKTNELQNFWQQNKDAIKNPRLDNGKSQTEYNSRYQDVLGYVNTSKNEELKKKPFVDALADPDKRQRITDKMLYDIGLHDLPLTDPNRKSFDITQETFNPKELSVEEVQKITDNIGKGIVADKNEIISTPDPNDRFTFVETTTARFSPEKLISIGEDARKTFLNSDELQYTLRKQFEQYKGNEKEFNKLNDVYKSVYGTDIQDNDDLFTATILQKKIEPTVSSKTRDNYGARLQAQEAKERRMENLRTANDKELAKFRKSLGGDGEGGDKDEVWVESYLDNLTKEAMQKNPFPYTTSEGEKSKEYEINLDPTLKKSLEITIKGNKGQSPDRLLYNPETKKYRPIYYLTDENFNPKEKNGQYLIDADNSKPLTKEQLKLVLGVKTVSATQRTKEMTSSNQPKTTAEDLRKKYNY